MCDYAPLSVLQRVKLSLDQGSPNFSEAFPLPAMNLHPRAKLSTRMIFPSPPPRKPFVLLRIINTLQRFNFYSIETTSNIKKTYQFTKPGARKSSQISPILNQGIKKHSEVLTSWPRPREIPYQPKIANLVNLIGHVQTAVRFEVSSNGKRFAAAVISQADGGEKNSLLIPLVFEGDLAHIVACHVKENDTVFVSGKLSRDHPMQLMLNQYLGSFCVLAENLKFVGGLEVNFLEKREGVLFNMDSHILGRNDGEIVDKVKFKPGKGKGKSIKRTRKKKDTELQLDLWRELVKNPLQWWDYRDHKSNGLIKENFPDFKQKVTDKGLWLSSAPEWVLPGLGKLEFDVKVIGERPGEMDRPSQLDRSWKNLVENPDKWWDNRANKRNPKGPDFKHKETGEALWLSSSPAWVLPGLPPSRYVRRLVIHT
ncbi:protein OSB2, chloroplastic-like [Henckelia pumila]|uniref:protein OSB2, chloroplastic-like n=1 Tax=Henckelia pumila TaxID=405737 RepID=UPI003C6DE714